MRSINAWVTAGGGRNILNCPFHNTNPDGFAYQHHIRAGRTSSGPSYVCLCVLWCSTYCLVLCFQWWTTNNFIPVFKKDFVNIRHTCINEGWKAQVPWSGKQIQSCRDISHPKSSLLEKWHIITVFYHSLLFLLFFYLLVYNKPQVTRLLLVKAGKYILASLQVH